MSRARFGERERETHRSVGHGIGHCAEGFGDFFDLRAGDLSLEEHHERVLLHRSQLQPRISKPLSVTRGNSGNYGEKTGYLIAYGPNILARFGYLHVAEENVSAERPPQHLLEQVHLRSLHHSREKSVRRWDLQRRRVDEEWE